MGAIPAARNWELGLQADVGHLACESAACGSSTMPTGAWHCAAISYDAAAIRVYLNGTLDNAPPQTFNGSRLNPFLCKDVDTPFTLEPWNPHI